MPNHGVLELKDWRLDHFDRENEVDFGEDTRG
jgi:hypothetical protein